LAHAPASDRERIRAIQRFAFEREHCEAEVDVGAGRFMTQQKHLVPACEGDSIGNARRNPMLPEAPLQGIDVDLLRPDRGIDVVGQPPNSACDHGDAADEHVTIDPRQRLG
jgi:hypothetical protein